MAIKQPKPQPGYQLRHRLTGAVIIVTFTVVIIPFLLHSPSPENGSQISDDSDTITKQDGLTESQVPISHIEPLIIELDKAQSQSEELVGSAPSSAASQGDQQNRQGNDQPFQPDDRTGQQAAVTTTADTVQQAAVTTTTDPVQQTGQAWFVRVGTYVNIKNINSISKLLADNGFEARHTEVQTSNAKAVRVWLGPYYDREKAEQARFQAKNLTNEKVYVTEQAP